MLYKYNYFTGETWYSSTFSKHEAWILWITYKIYRKMITLPDCDEELAQVEYVISNAFVNRHVICAAYTNHNI